MSVADNSENTQLEGLYTLLFGLCKSRKKEVKFTELDNDIEEMYNEDGEFFRHVFRKMEQNDFYRDHLFEQKAMKRTHFKTWYQISKKETGKVFLMMKYDKVSYFTSNNKINNFRLLMKKQKTKKL